LFNALATELWRRTMIYMARALGQVTGVGVAEISQHARLSYVKVAEFQKRGLVHLHGVIRVDSSDRGEVRRSRLTIGPDALARAFVTAARKVTVPYPDAFRRYGWRVRWGEQIDLAVISGGEADAMASRKVAAYCAKYAVKSTHESGALDRAVATANLARLDLSDHFRKLVATALSLGTAEEACGANKKLNLSAWAHTLGYRGHFLTKSQGYSTTFKHLREERADYVKATRGIPFVEPDFDPANPSVVDYGDWSFTGMGYTTSGDAWLAASLYVNKEAMRKASREVLGGEAEGAAEEFAPAEDEGSAERMVLGGEDEGAAEPMVSAADLEGVG
jgi:hypothetical protein